MPSAKALLLVIQVKLRVSDQKLKEYSNESGAATTIDEDALGACADDALGDFRNKAGVEPDMDNALHISKLVSGTLYYLMFYKGRDASLLKNYEKKFYAGMQDIANRHYPKAISNSKVEQSEQRQGTLPDMDRSLAVFSGGGSSRGTYIPSETIE